MNFKPLQKIHKSILTLGQNHMTEKHKLEPEIN